MDEKQKLIIPIYLNETIVMDMLAIMEDGFSMVSEVSSSNAVSQRDEDKFHAGFSTSDLFSKLLKIDLGTEINTEESTQEAISSKRQKVHTSTSLLSRFREKLNKDNIIVEMSKENSDISKLNVGDFVEVSGTLNKNPMVNILESAIDVFKMVDIFSNEPTLGNKKSSSSKKSDEQKLVKQMKLFLDELKVTGTIDFVIENGKSTIVLSAQEKYLQNDNISELLGGTFRVLGKVIRVCKDEKDSINLLRKTTLNVLKDSDLKSFTDVFESDDLKNFNLPEVKIQIDSPAIIMIPIAIYV